MSRTSEVAQDLIWKLLDPNAHHRITISEALNHEWFENQRDELENFYRLKVIEQRVDGYGSLIR